MHNRQKVALSIRRPPGNLVRSALRTTAHFYFAPLAPNTSGQWYYASPKGTYYMPWRFSIIDHQWYAYTHTSPLPLSWLLPQCVPTMVCDNVVGGPRAQLSEVGDVPALSSVLKAVALNTHDTTACCKPHVRYGWSLPTRCVWALHGGHALCIIVLSSWQSCIHTTTY